MRYCRVTPETKSGIDELASPSVTIDRSASVLRRRAANMPAAMANGTVRRGRGDELRRAAEGRQQQVADRAAELVRVAVVERDRALEQPAVLVEQRVVGADLLVDWRRPSPAGANGPRILRPGSDGQHVDDHEDDRDEQEQRDDRQRQPAEHVPGHGRPLSRAAASGPVDQTLRRLPTNIWPSADTRTSLEGVGVAGQVVVEERHADRDVLVEDRLERAGRLGLGLDPDRAS